VSAIELMKKAMAKTVVALERNVAAPLPPKTAPVIPEPPKAPASPSPLLDCKRTVIIRPAQIRICNRIKNEYKTPPLTIKLIFENYKSTPDLTIFSKESTSRLAPPTKAPSISCSFKRSLAFSGFTEPP
jgi:hypothetical protein